MKDLLLNIKVQLANWNQSLDWIPREANDLANSASVSDNINLSLDESNVGDLP